jgi:hypothetical protein
MTPTHTLSHPWQVALLFGCTVIPECIDITNIDHRLIEPALHLIQIVAGIAALVLSYRTLKLKK